MKRIWLAAAIMAGMVILCTVFLLYTEKVTADLDRRLDRLSAAPDSTSAADAPPQEQMDELLAVWERYEKRLSLHTRHSELEEVTAALTHMEYSLSLGSRDRFLVACGDARIAIEHLREEERPLLRNIF